jgi:hypothetical protein
VALLAKLMRQNDVDPAAAAAKVSKLGAADRPVFETAAEFMGPGAEGLQTALGNVTGPSKEALRSVFSNSIRNIRTNITEAAKKATGKDPDRFHAEQRAHDEMRATRDTKQYEAVEGHPLGGNRPPLDAFVSALFKSDPAEPHLQPVAFRPRFAKYVKQTLDNAKANGDWMAKELSRFYQQITDRQVPVRALSVRAINEIDKNIGQDIEVAAAKGRNNDVRQLRQLQEGLRRTDFDTGLGGVRMDASIGFTAQEAFKKGREAFRNGVDLEDVVAHLHEYPQEIADNYLTGMVRHISDELANQRNLGGLADAADKIAATPAMRDKLTSALPKTKAGKLTANSQRFMDVIDRVQRHTNQARSIYGNSRTAPRQAAIVDAEEQSTSVPNDVMDFIGELVTRQPGQTMQRLGTAVRNRVTRPGIYNPKINAALGKRLGATGREDITHVLDEVGAWNNRPISPLAKPWIPETAGRIAGVETGTKQAEQDPWARNPSMARADAMVDAFERPLVEEYLSPSTSPSRRAEIEGRFGDDAPALRELRRQRGAQAAAGPFDQVSREFPGLAKALSGVAFKNSPASPGDRRGLEFYPQGEEDSYDRTRPAIETFGDRASPSDIAADLVSHYLAQGGDPKITATYKQFEKSLTPDQQSMIRRRYEFDRKHGENRSFKDWYRVSGLPMFFRGYAFNQLDDGDFTYTPEQKQLFDEMMGGLRGQRR